MLKCSCGHDNFPLTSAYNGHDFATRIVEFCHQCGRQITEKCVVCDRLHPLGAKTCSVYGLGIEAFNDSLVGLETRAKIFKKSPEVMNVMIKWTYFAKRIKKIFFVGLLLLGIGLVAGFTGEFNILSLSLLFGFIALIYSCLRYVGANAYARDQIEAIWRNKYPGTLEPSRIFVYSTYIYVEFDSNIAVGYSSHCMPIKNRLRNFILAQQNPAH